MVVLYLTPARRFEKPHPGRDFPSDDRGHLLRNGGQLRDALEDISDGVDIIDTAQLKLSLVATNDLPVLLTNLDTDSI